LTAQDRREIEALYQQGLEALQQKRNDDAVRYFEIVWSRDPGHSRVAEYLKREYLTRGLEAFASGRLRDAVALWEQALRVDPKDDRTRAYLARAQEHLARTSAIGGR
ncbi:MAG: tetratricopeptide repeat protein, partial [Candidatus Eisenbacteria bacterium]|nr:tetratricopeptide repeat protein [Candidatus Eisenbacteria bacterium]